MTDPIEAAKALPAAKNEPAEDRLGDGGQKALAAERTARRDAERQLRESQDRVRELEGAETRRDVASAKGLTPSQANRLVGATREELEADADDLLSAFAPPQTAGGMRKSPVEKLLPGAAPSAEALDAGAIADRILSK